MSKKHKQSGTAHAPASSAYVAAFEQDLAAMTVAEFIRWNPRFTEEEARARITAAKAKVDRMKHKQPSAGVFDARDLSPAGTPEEIAEQTRQAVVRGQAAIDSRTPAEQLEHENKLLAEQPAGSGEKMRPSDYEPDDGTLTARQVAAIKADAAEHLPKGKVLSGAQLVPTQKSGGLQS